MKLDDLLKVIGRTVRQFVEARTAPLAERVARIEARVGIETKSGDDYEWTTAPDGGTIVKPRVRAKMQ